MTVEPPHNARELAAAIFNAAGITPPREIGRIPLKAMTTALGLRVGPRRDTLGLIDGALHPDDGALQPDLFGNEEVRIWAQGARARFTIAHELAHRAIRLFAGKIAGRELRGEDLRRLVDETASLLLVPDSVLPQVLAAAPSWEPGYLAQTANVLGVSLPVLSIRIQQVVLERRLSLPRGIVVVARDKARKRMTVDAPRIAASVVPLNMYLPVNKRLATLGLAALLKVYIGAPPFIPGVIRDRLSLWSRDIRRWVNLDTTFRYTVFLAGGAAASRILLATFDAAGAVQTRERVAKDSFTSPAESDGTPGSG